MADFTGTWRTSQAHQGQDITDRDLVKKFAEAEEKLIELSELKSKDQRPDMSVRAALSSVGWKPDTLANRVIEYSVLDFEFAEKPKVGTLMGFSYRLVDFFVADPRGYGSIFLKMADNFKDKIFLNKVVKSVSTAVMAFIELLPWMERCSLGNMDSALSVQAFFQVIQSSFPLNFLSGKLKPLTRFHCRTTQKFSSSSRTSSGTATNSSCSLTGSGDIIQYGWTSKHVTFYQIQPFCT